MTMRTVVSALALTAASTAAASAQTVDRANGESGATVLQLTTVPRAAAMGGALTASDGIASLFANPAGLATVARFTLHASGQTIFDDAKAGSMALGFRASALRVAVGARYLNLGSIDELVCNGCGGQGSATGITLSAHELAATGGAALTLGGSLSVGAAINFFSTSVADKTGSSMSFSGGVRYPARANARLSAGASVQFVGGSVDLAGFSSPLPQTLRAGIELRPLRPEGSLHLALAADYVGLKGAPGRIVGGAELGLGRPGSFELLGRFGFASGADADYGTKAISFGGGLVLGPLALDYAYQGSDVFGTQQRFGVTVGR
ncbi:MAG: hypothetical protein AABY85_08880 [Gemmatimonadota bacterium]